MPLDDVFDLHDILFVPRLTRKLIFISAITKLKCIVKFNDRQCTIKNFSEECGQVFDKRVQKGGIHKVLAHTLMHDALVHDGDKLCKTLAQALWPLTLWSTYSLKEYDAGISRLQG
jgi:hypothetical protein